MNAITGARVGFYTAPIYDKKDIRTKQQAWNEFMDSLNWEHIHKTMEEKKTGKNIKKMFASVGIPIIATGNKKEGDK